MSVRAVQGTDWTEAFRTHEALHTTYAIGAAASWKARRASAAGPVGFEADDDESINEKRSAARTSRTSAADTKQKQEAKRLRKAEKEWITEARRVHAHLQSISKFLATIRRPYLSTSGPSSHPAAAEATDEDDDLSGASGAGDVGGLKRWARLGTLSEEQRDEIDFAVKMALKGALERVRELEKGEEVRLRTTPSLSLNPLARLLRVAPDPLFPGRAHPEFAATLTSHRASITASLGAQLASVGAALRDLQERRLKSRRALARVKAGASAARVAQEEASAPAPIAGVSGALGMSAPSSAQAQMFDEEASALIKTLEADLAAVEAAERKLTEIAQLQTTLVQHLAQQADVTSHLQSEALGHAAEVGRGNQQLEKAKAANRSATKMLSIFLIGSGLGLLFLHWMD